MKANRETHNQALVIIKHNRPLTFYLLSIIIPWALWFTAGYFSHLTPVTKSNEWVVAFTSFAGLLAPFAIAMWFILPDKDLRSDLAGRFFNFKNIKARYLLISFGLMLISIILAQAISLLFGYSSNQFHFIDQFSFSSAIFPVWFLLIVSPLFEELAWHTYGTDCLLSRFNLFTASLFFAIFWAFWHFPLSSIKDYYHSNLVESGLIYSINFVVSLIPFVFIMNWLYYKTNRNILLPIVFHISAGMFNEIFQTHPMSKVIQTIILIIVAIIIVYREPDMFFKRIKCKS